MKPVEDILIPAPGVRPGAWQPIDTAPKDGTPILGYAENPPFGFGGYAVVSWNGKEWDLCQTGSFAEDGTWWPEQWQPLPEKPKKDKK